MQKGGKKAAASPRGSRAAANNHKQLAALSMEEDEADDVFDDEEDEEEDDMFEEDEMPGSKARGKWAAEEDELLREAVQTHGGRNWKRISEILVGRTDVQCLHRW